MNVVSMWRSRKSSPNRLSKIPNSRKSSPNRPSKIICILSICELGIWHATTSHDSHCVNKEACCCMIVSTMADCPHWVHIHDNEFTSTRKYWGTWNSYTAIQTKPTMLATWSQRQALGFHSTRNTIHTVVYRFLGGRLWMLRTTELYYCRHNYVWIIKAHKSNPHNWQHDFNVSNAHLA